MNEFIARNGLIAQNNSTVSGSLTVTAGITGSLLGTSSYATTASYALTSTSASYALTSTSASFATNATTAATASYANNFTVAGTLTAQTLVVQTITSSTVYSSGSNIFGNSLANTQTFTGSMYQTGSVAAFMGSVGIGTTSPSNKLYVSATVEDYVAVIENLGTGTAKNGLWIKTDSSFTNSTVLKVTGTTSDSETLQVNPGQVRIGPGSIGQFDGTLFLTSSATTVANFVANNSSALFISGSGNVGIGTTSPSRKLTVSNPVNGDIALFTNTVDADLLVNLTSGVTLLTPSTGILALGTSLTERMRIDASGNVGIGTPSPYEKLEVNGAISAIGAINGISAQGHSTTLAVQSGTSFLYAVDWGAEFKPLSVQAKTISLETGTGSTTARITIDNSGNVGIGTTTPSNKLQVVGGVTATSFTGSFSGSAAAPGSTTQVLYNNGGTISGASGLVYSGSSVGIGTTTPIYPLDVDGNSTGIAARFYNSSVTNTEVYIGDSGNSNYSNLLLDSDSGTAQIWKGGSAYSSFGGAASLNLYNSNGAIAFHPAGIFNAVYINTSGDVLVGTTTSTYSTAGRGVVQVNGSSTAIFGLTVGGVDTGYLYHGGTDMSLWNTISGNIQIGTGNVERVRITSGGNVGIGTTNPGRKFVVTGAANDEWIATFTNTGTNPYGVYIDTSANSGAAYSFATYTNAGTGFFVLNNGNVGIGSTVPNEKLTVNGKGYFISYTPAVISGGGNPYYGTNLTLSSDIGSTQGASRIWSRYDGTGAPAISFERSTTDQSYNADPQSLSYTEVMRISGAGNVGIGTSSPGFKLEVSGSAKVTYLQIQNNGYAGGLPTTPEIYSPASATLAISAGGAERLRIDSNGNVGIGTSSPGALLHIQSSSPELLLYNTTTAGGTLNFVDQSWQSQIVGIQGNLLFKTGGTTEHMRITNDGNVGIGTTNPGAKFQVSAGRSHFFSGDNYSVALAQTAAQGNYMYLGTAADGTFYISETSGTARVTVQQGGNVGIGTTSPLSTLHVNGTMRTVLSSGAGGQTLISAISGVSNGYLIEVDTSNNITHTWHTGANAASLYISAAGNVGIGSTAPTQGKLVVNGGVYATSFTGSLQGSSSYATTASYSLNAGSSATFNNNTNNYIMTGTGTTNTLNGESNLQYDGNGLFIGNAGSIPGSPANGTVLYSEDVASSSELKVKDEAGNITTLSPHNFSLIPQGPSEALAWSYYSEKDGKKINVDMLKLARTLEKLTGEKLVYIE